MNMAMGYRTKTGSSRRGNTRVAPAVFTGYGGEFD
jgi:hypothetical protein